MKIFFSASREGFDQYQVNYKKIIDILRKEGHTVFEDVIANAKGHVVFDDFEERFQKIKTWIKEADVVISEISTPSTGLGHEIYQATSEKKQVLVLIDDKIERDMAATLRGNPSKNITFKEYNDNTIESVLNAFMQFAKKISTPNSS